MKKLLATLICACGLIAMTSTASKAILIVDTGEPTSASAPASGLYGGSLDGDLWNEGQWLAGQFSISESYTINSILGFMSTKSGSTLTMSLYGNSGNNIPDTTSTPHYQSKFTLGEGVEGEAYAWHGLTNLNISLDPASYWVAFEVRPGDDYSGFMRWGAPTPLDLYASTGSTGIWSPAAASNPPTWGLRIAANENHVIPEPATMVLFGIGLTGMALKKRRG